MKLIRTCLGIIFISLIAACGQSEQTPLLEPQVVTTYQVSSENFQNPERGFFVQRSGWDKVLNPNWEFLTLREYATDTVRRLQPHLGVLHDSRV